MYGEIHAIGLQINGGALSWLAGEALSTGKVTTAAAEQVICVVLAPRLPHI
jgi:hypothetical protein